MDDGVLLVTAPQSPFDFGLRADAAAPAPPARRTPLEAVALALAIVVAPVGLLVSIIAAAVCSRRLGYVNGLARAGLAVSIVLTLVWVGGAAAWGYYAAGQAHEASLRASTQPMCRVLAQKPGVLADPAFGWPAVTSTIPVYETAAADYTAWWSTVAAAAPAQERAQAAAVVSAAKAAVARMTASQVVDHDADYADLRAVATGSSLPAWAAEYCAG